ncbi:MAG: hypothetical protein P9M11_03450 [Candidatus Tenebribacter burtonii]|jgi:hypothetical protein|nr:hypothetical protein [Candidatus Tenebribacter burtonii]
MKMKIFVFASWLLTVTDEAISSYIKWLEIWIASAEFICEILRKDNMYYAEKKEVENG